MEFRVAYVTNTGKTRSANQDALLVQKTLVTEVSMDAPVEETVTGEVAWFLVADGMGGESLGEVASRETLRILSIYLPGMLNPEDLPLVLQRAKERLGGIALEERVRLGATLAGLLVTPGGALAFNVGDCRVYKLRAGFLNRLTRDHSLLEEAIAAGLPEGEVARNIVTSAIMGGDQERMQIFQRPLQLRSGECFLVCCDGLWGALPVEEMEAAFAGAAPLEAMSRLLQAALPKSDDNISGIIVQVV